MKGKSVMGGKDMRSDGMFRGDQGWKVCMARFLLFLVCGVFLSGLLSASAALAQLPGTGVRQPAFQPQGQPHTIQPSSPVLQEVAPVPPSPSPAHELAHSSLSPNVLPKEKKGDDSVRITPHPLDRLIDLTSDSRTLLNQVDDEKGNAGH